MRNNSYNNYQNYNNNGPYNGSRNTFRNNDRYERIPYENRNTGYTKNNGDYYNNYHTNDFTGNKTNNYQQNQYSEPRPANLRNRTNNINTRSDCCTPEGQHNTQLQHQQELHDMERMYNTEPCIQNPNTPLN
jgi:hypothetical protein